MNSRILLGVCMTVAVGSAYAQSLTPPAQSAQQVMIDPGSGQPRAPEHDEITSRPAATARSLPGSPGSAAITAPATPSMFESHPAVKRMQAAPAPQALHGATIKRLGVDKMSFSMATKQADGKVNTTCVAGEDAATALLHGHALGGQNAQ